MLDILISNVRSFNVEIFCISMILNLLKFWIKIDALLVRLENFLIENFSSICLEVCMSGRA